MYIEPGSASQSLIMYLQDAVTGWAYLTEDQADWTFYYLREGDDGTDYTNQADASITAGTLGTWAEGTAKPFGSSGLWQIDFADAAFAAGAGYVKLLVTHDNGNFIPKSVTIDLSVRQADAVEISGDSTAANNLELQYNTTGLTGGTFPASQAQVGASVVEFPDAGRMMAGASESNTYAKLAANDDDYWSCTDPDNSNPLEMCVYVNAGSGTFPDAVVVDARYNAQNNRRVHVFAANVDDIAAISDAAATATDASPSVLTHSVAGSFAGLTLATYDIYITSGTNATAGFYTIASHTDDVITLDRNCSSGGAVSSIDFIVMVWDQISNDTNAILHKTGADGDYEYPLGVSYMTTDNNEVFLRFSDEGQSQFKTTYDLRLDLVGVITKSLVGGSVSAETYAAAVHTELDDHFRHMPSFTGEVFYVSTTGSDSNSGHDPASPLLTITAAIAAASAGDLITIKAGTYAEVVTLAADGLELHCEIGTIINGNGGVPLTISADSCKVLGAYLVPDDGQIGCVVSGDYNYMQLCQSHTTGTSGWQITTTGAGNEFVDCVAENFTAAGWDIKGPNNIFHLCLAVGEGGSETGFHLSDTAAHRNLFDNCSTIDCATAGWKCDVGADDNLFNFCSDSDGCGAKVDAGTNNAWRGFGEADIPAANVTQVSDDTTAADNLEAAFDGTGYSHLYQQMARESRGASGVVYHIKLAGGEDDSKDGLSWATAKETVGPLVKEVVENDTSAGDKVLVGSGVFALGDNTLNVPADVALIGEDWNATEITSTADAVGGKGAIIHPNDRSIIKRLTVRGIAAADKYQYPLGAYEANGDAAFANAVVEDVRLIADTDGLYIHHTGACSMIGRNLIIETKFDSLVIREGAHKVWLIDPKIVTKGPSGTGLREATGIKVTAGTVYAVNPDISVSDVATNGTATQVGIWVSGATARGVFWNPRVAVTEDGTINRSILQADSGTLTVIGGDYDRSMETGTITHISDIDSTLDYAIPGSPTADSINERIKAIDVLTEDAGDGDLAAILLDVTGLNGVSAVGIADAVLSRNVSNVEATMPEHCLGTFVMAGLQSEIIGSNLVIYRTDGTTVHATKPVSTDAAADPITGVS